MGGRKNKARWIKYDSQLPTMFATETYMGAESVHPSGTGIQAQILKASLFLHLPPMDFTLVFIYIQTKCVRISSCSRRTEGSFLSSGQP